ncbi:MAG: ribonuclease J, partial [Stappiaceae bacterium]
LARIGNDDHRHVTLSRGDMVIFSARTIPGNEKAVGAVINGLVDQGMDVVTDRDGLVHVSGHPRKGELEQLYNLLKPQLLVPVHGEPLHLEAQVHFARKNGIKEIVSGRNGDIIRLAPGPGKVIDDAPSGILVKDGLLLIDPEVSGIQERRKLSFVGVATGYITMNRAGEIQGDPDVILFGLPECDQHGDDFEDIALDGLEGAVMSIPKSRRRDANVVTEAARRGLRSAIAERWGKKPLCRVVVNVI